MMKRLLAVLILSTLIPGIVHAQWEGGNYFGKTTVNTGNQNIVVRPTRTTVPMVGLENRSDKPARCSATFSNGAQFSETRVANIAPGKKATLAYPVHYVTDWVDINVACSERRTRG